MEQIKKQLLDEVITGIHKIANAELNWISGNKELLLKIRDYCLENCKGAEGKDYALEGLVIYINGILQGISRRK